MRFDLNILFCNIIRLPLPGNKARERIQAHRRLWREPHRLSIQDDFHEGHPISTFIADNRYSRLTFIPDNRYSRSTFIPDNRYPRLNFIRLNRNIDNKLFILLYNTIIVNNKNKRNAQISGIYQVSRLVKRISRHNVGPIRPHSHINHTTPHHTTRGQKIACKIMKIHKKSRLRSHMDHAAQRCTELHFRSVTFFYDTK